MHDVDSKGEDQFMADKQGIPHKIHNTAFLHPTNNTCNLGEGFGMAVRSSLRAYPTQGIFRHNLALKFKPRI
jgi:hypothetical protein